MKGHDDVITLLNEILTAELTAINQYFIHARMCENWGYERLWKKVREESIGEMRHADRLIARILDLERAAVTALNNGIERCRSLGDNGSRELLEEILVSEEEHINWIEAQLELIRQTGEGNYLAQQIKKEE